jgi:hypothetical protein
MTTHHVKSPLDFLPHNSKEDDKHPFPNGAIVYKNPVAKYGQIINDLMKLAKEPAFNHYTFNNAKINANNTYTRCNDMKLTIEGVTDPYIKGHPDKKFISGQVSDAVISACNYAGGMLKVTSIKDINGKRERESIIDRLKSSLNDSLKNAKRGGTRKSIRRKSKTRRYRR